MTTPDYPPAHIDSEHQHRRDTPPVQSHTAATYERRLALLREHDAQVCTCGHRCITHGSYGQDQTFIGVGLGPCGWPRCECVKFTPSGASSSTGFVPIPDYDREPSESELNSTCDDCHAAPGEHCHWACSSWWA